MRKSQTLNKLLLGLFLISFTTSPALAIEELLTEEEPVVEVVQPLEVDNSEDILEEGISDPEEIAKEEELPEETSESSAPTEEVKEETVKPIWNTLGVFAETSEPVELNRTYYAPQNSKVSVTFTKLPETPKPLRIVEITLTEAEMEATGSISNLVYDITTEMAEGTYEYDLTLPSDGEGEFDVVYAEARSELLTGTEEVNENVIEIGNTVKVEGVDHFTIFVVTRIGAFGGSRTCIDGVCYKSIQEAIDNAQNGDTIQINKKSGIFTSDYSEHLTIHNKTDLTIEGIGNPTLYVTGNYGLDIQNCTNLTLRGMTLIGYGSTRPLYVIHASGVNGLNVQNLSISSASRTGLDVIGGSNITINNVRSSFNNGNGIHIRNTSNIAISNIETSFNGWLQGLVINAAPGYYTPEVNSVTLSGTVNTLDPAGVSIQDAGGEVSGVTIMPGTNMRGTLVNDSVNNVQAYGVNWGVNGRNRIESRIYHDCAASPFSHGTCQPVHQYGDRPASLGSVNYLNNLTPALTADILETRDTTPTITGSYTDVDTSTIVVTVNGVDYSPILNSGNWEVTTDPLVDGIYDISVNADDWFNSPVSDQTTDELLIDNTAPTTTSPKMYVSRDGGATFEESTFVTKGDVVRVETEAADTGSGIDYVRFAIRNPNGGYVARYEAISAPVQPGSNLYRYEFTIPTDGEYIDTHQPISQDLDGLIFWVRAYDNLGNYNHGMSNTFTYDLTQPTISQPRMLVSRDNGSTFELSTRVNYGDIVKIQAEANDTLSGVESVEFRIQDKDTGEYVSSREFVKTPTSGNTYEYTFSIPSDERYINTHGLISKEEQQLRFWVRAHDVVGNYAHGASGLFTYDTEAPSVPTGLTILDHEGNNLGCRGITNNRRITVDWNDNPETDFDHYIYGIKDNEFFRELTASQVTGNIRNIDGDYRYIVRAVDEAGNVGQPTEWCGVILDRVAPEGTIDGITYTTPRTGFVTSDNTPILFGTYSDNIEVANVEIELGGRTMVPQYSNGEWDSDDFGPLTEGVHTATLTITDAAGNVTVVTQDITIDTTAPTAIYTQYRNGIEITEDIAYVKGVNELTFTGEYADNLAGLSTDSFVIFQAQDDGSFRFSANGKRAYCSWRREPNLVHISGLTDTTDAPVEFSLCEATLPDGEYYMAHQVADEAVRDDIPSINQFRDVLGLHFIVDNVNPTVEITTPSDGDIIRGNLVANATVADNQALLRYYVRVRNLDTNQVIYSTVVYSDGITDEEIFNRNLPDGNYEIHVAARDKAMNRGSESEQTIRVVVDNTRPTGTVLTPLHNEEIKDIVTVSGSSDDNLSGVDRVMIRLRSTETRERTSWMPAVLDTNGDFRLDVDTTGLTEGSYRVSVRVYDNAGNRRRLRQRPVVIIDRTAPTMGALSDMTLTEGETFPTTTVALTDINTLDRIFVEATDLNPSGLGTGMGDVAVSGVTMIGDQFPIADEIRKEIEAWQGNPFATIDLNVLPEGQYLITYYATDLAGNESTHQSFTVTILDNVPTVTVATGSTEVTVGDEVVLSANIANGNAVFTYLWSGDCTGSAETTTLNTTVAGTYSCTVTVTDDDGDVDTDTIVVTVNEAQAVAGVATQRVLAQQTTGNEETQTTEEPTEKEEEAEEDVKGAEDVAIEDISTEEGNSGWWKWLIGGVSLFILLYLFILWRRRKEEEEEIR